MQSYVAMKGVPPIGEDAEFEDASNLKMCVSNGSEEFEDASNLKLCASRHAATFADSMCQTLFFGE